MKAVIMAGGDGTRLRPVSSDRPKPMTELLDRPVLERILRLLKQNGILEACLTLKYLPEMIMDYFGSGEAFGMQLDYRVETEARGTAGSVKSCADFIGDEDFIVLSGDCVCNFDLKRLMDFHRQKKAEATLALYSHNTPLEYGLVVTDESGRIERFVEKPGWEHVLTDTVNTGIYILGPGILEEIPDDKPYDFGRELYPLLLEKKRALYGCAMDGYWCDIGSVESYLQCCMDILDGRTGITPDSEQIKNGVWAERVLPESAEIVPPVYIGRGSEIGNGVCLGPYAVIASGSVVASGAKVSYSAVNGALVGENALVTGAVVCRNASVGRGAVLNEGAVVGAGSQVGQGSVLGSSARLWPDRQIPAGSVITGDISFGMLKREPSFSQPGIITGPYGAAVTAEYALKLGKAAGVLYKRVGIAWSGGEAARILAEAFGSGVCAAGGNLVRHDAAFTAGASYAGTLLGLELSVYIESGGDDIVLTLFGKDGLGLTHEAERKLEAAVSSSYRSAPVKTGHATDVKGISEAHSAAAARHGEFSADGAAGFCVAVTGRGAENRTLKSALELLGVNITNKISHVLHLEIPKGGRMLEAADEEGYRLSSEQVFALSSLVEFKSGVKAIAVQEDAPAVLESMAQEFNADIYRIGRDGVRAQELHLSQNGLRDGIFMGARLCAYLAITGQTLSALRSCLPGFASVTREVALQAGRGAVMRRLYKECPGIAPDSLSGIRLETELGCVTISPMRGRSALKIRSESFSEETAEELCADFEQRTRRADKTDTGV